MEPNSSLHNKNCDRKVFMRKWNTGSLFHHQFAPVFLLNRNGDIIQVSSRFREMFNGKIIGQHYTTLVEEEDISRAEEIFRRALQGDTVEAEGIRCSTRNDEGFFRITAIPLFEGNAVTGICCMIMDTNRHLLAEEALSRSEAALRMVSHIVKLGTWEWDLKQRAVHLSHEMYTILGLKPSCSTAELFACEERVHREDYLAFRRAMKSILEGQPASIRLRYHHPDGSIRHLEMMGELLSGHGTETKRVVVATRDITVKTQSLEKLRRSEDLYRLISENSQDFITLSDADGMIRYASPGVSRLLGYDPEEVTGKHRLFLYHPDHRKDGEVTPENESHVAPVRCMHKNGHSIWIEMSVKRIMDETGELSQYLGIGRDITERMAAEELVHQSEKLTLTGQLAAGIAHEIRNPLTAIKGFLQLLDGGFTLRKEHVAVMSSELMRIEGILNELLLLAKPHELKFYRQDVNQIVHQVVTLMETEANMKNVVLHYHPWGESLPVACDENQLKQVFINLIKNGMESMPGGGELIVHTESRDQKAAVIFTDCGSGIPEDILKRIGQPFLTTKEKGTGLGLATSFSIIENHNGNVKVKSELGKGTEFTVQLPLTH